MTSPAASRAERPRADRIAAGIDALPTPAAAVLAEYLADVFGPATVALIHYGSQAQRSDPRPESAYDFFVVVERYGPAFASLTERVGTRFSAATASTLARALPPNIVAITARLGAEETRSVKCAVYSVRDFERACGPRAQDHFAQGRLFQVVQLAWARDPQWRDWTRGLLVSVRERTWWWGRPFLPPVFDVDAYVRTLLRTSFSAEIRPESGERVRVLLEAQRDTLAVAYGALLEQLAEQGAVREVPGGLALAEPPTAAERRRVRRYFRRSKARATLRWSKYVALYDDWLGYIVRKIERRSGVAVELTERERRWPLIFLWPRAIRFVLTRDQVTSDQHRPGR